MQKRDAERLLGELGAPARLVTHVGLVGEALEDLLAWLHSAGVAGVRLEFARAAVVLHDVGKVQHPAELDGPGHQHEAAGERLLLSHGVDPALARVCRTHASWQEDGLTLEELLVALADKLWKGKRVAALEEKVLGAILAASGRDRWETFVPFDDLCERVASQGPERLERSRRAG